MILGRRASPGLRHRLRGLLWPRSGWRRAGRYLLLRLGRLRGTPRAVAAGLATGVAVSLTPFLGLHLVLAVGIARAFRASVLAAALGTLLVVPWIVPAVLLATYRLGCLILGRRVADLAAVPHHPGALLHEAGTLLWPMTVGSAPIAAAAWATTYLLAMRALVALRDRSALHGATTPANSR